MVKALLPQLKTVIQQDWNVLLSGKHGIGKTFEVLRVVEDLGWSMKYYSTSTLDPYVDLVGVPVPVDNDDGTRDLDMVRPKDMDNVELIFFDELNRADPKTLNAVFEVIQFRTINGIPLPKLRSVVAAINPVDGEYNTEELDPALIDRFHVFYNMTPKPPLDYLKGSYDGKLAEAFCDWWNGHNNGKREFYVSPRRLEYMIEVYSNTGSLDILRKTIPPDEAIDFGALKKLIQKAEGKIKVEDQDMARFNDRANWTKDAVITDLTEITEYVYEHPNDPVFIDNATSFLSGRVGFSVCANDIAELFVALHEKSPTHLSKVKQAWNPTKASQFRTALRDRVKKMDVGDNLRQQLHSLESAW